METLSWKRSITLVLDSAIIFLRISTVQSLSNQQRITTSHLLGDAFSHIPHRQSKSHISKIPGRTTRVMDTVPFKFVDSVVELLGWQTLDRVALQVHHGHWKPAIDLHYRNRVNYRLLFQKTERGANVDLLVNRRGEPDLSVSVQEIQRNRRFARIVEVHEVRQGSIRAWTSTKLLGKAETDKLLECVAPLIDQASYRYIESFFDLWKARGNLHFWLTFDQYKLDGERLRSLLSRGEVSEIRPNSREIFFKHETKKSIARVIKDRCFRMECYTCECDRFVKCLLKQYCTSHHDF
uniref:F-box domain-containing protein n=1 Tax=Steinernema glaseri TaxID=37863 RepID=A0A1I7YAC8_9BILA